MDVFQSTYWRMAVLAQKSMGVWPYDDGTLYNRIMPICFYMACYSLVIPVGIRGVEEIGVNNMIVLENLLAELYLHGAIIKLTATVVYKKKLKAVYDLIANDWKNTLDKEELKIMEDHASLGQKASIFYSMACLTTAVCFLSIPILSPPLLNFLIPIENSSRQPILPFHVEFGIDQEKYIKPLILSTLITGGMSVVVFATYDMSFAMCVQHVCSLFDVITLRLQRASQCASNQSASVNYTDADRQVFENLTEAIELHKIVITNVNILEDAYNTCWFFILVMNTFGLGGVLVFVIANLGDIEQLLRYGPLFIMIFIHKFYIFSPGQSITNYSLLVIKNCYSSNWFLMSPRCKFLIKFMMLRSIRPLELTGGKMFVLCMSTYGAMLKAGMSYFTMLANTRYSE